MELGNKIIDVIDTEVKSVIGCPDPEQKLMELYWDFWRQLKERAGTSSGFTGISEYLFFSYVRFYIERCIGGKFVAKPITNDFYSFQNKSIILTHDIDIQKINNALPSYKADIALFSNRDMDKQLIGALEIKVYISDRDILNNLLRRFRSLYKKTNSMLFSILFNRQYQSKFDQFASQLSNRFFIISEPGCYNNQISIDAAIDKMLSKL